MLHRSRSWPVQSVITLDPRGIIYAEVQPPGNEKIPKCLQLQPPLGLICDSRANVRPDVVLETDDRVPFPANPDIFLTLKPSPREGELKKEKSFEVTFYDHYQVLDSTFDEPNQEGFVVPVFSKENLKCRKQKVPIKSNDGALRNNVGVYFADDLVQCDDGRRVTVDDVEPVLDKCKRCRGRDPAQNQKFNQRKGKERGQEVRGPPDDVSPFLTNYQIDLLRKNCLKSLTRMRSGGSLDINSSLDRDSGGKPGRKVFERKLTAEFESVASNDTKTTDCDGDKCGGSKRRGKHEDVTASAEPGAASFHLIRSYSLGHEQTREKVTGTFKKFSLPTPIIQLKRENENAENEQEDKDSALQNLNLDKRKVMTLTRHYYPENGWGYVIVTCSVIVHILCHGFQLAAGVIMVPAALKFGINLVHTGKTYANF